MTKGGTEIVSQQAKWDIVVVGGANTDYVVRGPRLPTPGEVVEGDDFYQAPGGKGVNQAAAVARLDARVALVARVGCDGRGDAVLDRLIAEGVDTRYMVRDAEARTGVVLVQVDEQGQKQTLSAPGAMRRLTVDDVRAAAPAISAAQAVLVQLEVPLECVATAARIAHGSGARVVLDPSPPRPLPEDVLRLVDVIKPNAREAEVLTGVHVQDRDSARTAAEWLLQRGVGVVAVQAGDEGDLLVWQEDGRQQECWLPRLPVDTVDATGAGDALAAALAVALIEGRSLMEAGRFANAASMLTTMTFGVENSLPRRDEVQTLLKEIESGEVRSASRKTQGTC